MPRGGLPIDTMTPSSGVERTAAAGVGQLAGVLTGPADR